MGKFGLWNQDHGILSCLSVTTYCFAYLACLPNRRTCRSTRIPPPLGVKRGIIDTYQLRTGSAKYKVLRYRQLQVPTPVPTPMLRRNNGQPPRGITARLQRLRQCFFGGSRGTDLQHLVECQPPRCLLGEFCTSKLASKQGSKQ